MTAGAPPAPQVHAEFSSQFVREVMPVARDERSTTSPAWCGWIRGRKAGAQSSLRSEEGTFEIGAAQFRIEGGALTAGVAVASRLGLFCVFSGHLFNQPELARELTASGAPGDSPAEIILEGYRKWGDGMVPKLDGAFAWAVWDERRRRLLAARDALGLHPFYYSHSGEDLIFSWDFHTLRRHPLVSATPNRVWLAEMLCGRFLNPGETSLAGVRRLLGGHALVFSDGALRVLRYWDPAPPGRQMVWASEEEVHEFPAVLGRSVERVMQYGPAGLLLSGGLDSIGIAAAACDVAERSGWPKPRAYSMVLSEREAAIQHGVAGELGLPQTTNHISQYQNAGNFLQRTLDLAGTYPAPPISFLAPPFLDLQVAARQDGCRVLLTGDGGDEWLTVNPCYAAELIRHGALSRLIHLARTERLRGDLKTRSRAAMLRYLLWNCGLREILRDWAWSRARGLALARRRRQAPGAVPPWVAPDMALRRELLDRFEHWTRPPVQDSFYLQATREMLDEPLRIIAWEERFFRDRMVELPSLHPYWDRPLVEFLIRVRPEDLSRGFRSKALVRDIVSPRFPGLGLEDQRKILTPGWFEQIIRREGPCLTRQVRLAAAAGLVDPQLVRRMLDPSSCSDQILHRIWRVASLEAWLAALN